MVFVEGDNYRALRRPGDDPAQFRSTVRLPQAAAVPDSVIHQYRGENFTTSSWPDSVGNADMTIIGASVSALNGVKAASFDGADDHGIIPSKPLRTLPEQPAFSVALVFQDTSTISNTRWLGARNGSTRMQVADFDFSDGQTGNVGFIVEDGNDGFIKETDRTFNDGQPHLVVISKQSDLSGSVEFYIDDMTTPVNSTVTLSGQFDSSNYSISRNTFVGATNSGVGASKHRDTTISFLEFSEEPYSLSERQALTQRAPGV
jgi:hypothetical protein